MDSPSTSGTRDCPCGPGAPLVGARTAGAAIFDRASRFLTGAAALLLVWACLRNQRTGTVALAAVPAGLLGCLYALRHLRGDWKPRRTRFFSVHLVCLLLVVVPSALGSARPLLSGVVAAAVLFAYLCALAVWEAFTQPLSVGGSATGGAGASEISAPRMFAILVLVCTVSVVAGRLLAAVVCANGVAFSWQWMAPVSSTDVLGHLPAFLLVSSFPILVAASRVADRPGRAFLWRAGAALAAGGILFSFSRAAWIALAVEIALLAVTARRLRPRILAAGVACALVAVWFVPGVAQRAASVASGTVSTNRQRLEQWAVASDLVAASPVVGHGPGTFGDLCRQTAAARAYPWPHNLYLHIAAEAGLPALFVFLSWVAWGVLRGNRPEAAAADPWRDAMRQAFRVLLAGFLCYGLFDL